MLPTDDIPKLASKAAMNFCGMRAMISFRRALVEHHHAAYMSREGRLYYTLGSHGAKGGGWWQVWRYCKICKGICSDVEAKEKLPPEVAMSI
jgi:hypothetical protein